MNEICASGRMGIKFRLARLRDEVKNGSAGDADSEPQRLKPRSQAKCYSILLYHAL
ncbi:MAG: hypothetical protein ACRD8U_01260 [Pyrinomonadaceae bacterium]